MEAREVNAPLFWFSFFLFFQNAAASFTRVMKGQPWASSSTQSSADSRLKKMNQIFFSLLNPWLEEPCLSSEVLVNLDYIYIYTSSMSSLHAKALQ